MSSQQPMSNDTPIQQNLTSLPLEHVWKHLAIAGLLFFVFYFFMFSPPIFQKPPELPFEDVKQDESISVPTHVTSPPTNISHIMFGVISSMATWAHRRYYCEAWWRPNVTRGYVFFDRAPSEEFLPWPPSYPAFRVNEDISSLPVYPRIEGNHRRNQVRMFHTVLETIRQGDQDVRWYVMADDDTILFLDNLVQVLAKYNHSKKMYIGMNSECVKSNYDFSFDMAFGGAGYAISYPLAKVLVNKVEECIDRYPYLWVSDHMLYTCLADMGIAITHEKGFHQIDLRNDISGFLSSHPQAPILSLHHLDLFDPIFPTMNQAESMNHLMKVSKVDHSRVVQQTVCYHRPTNWTLSISWGYSAHLYENILPRSFLRKPLETFTPFQQVNPPIYLFNTRLPSDNPCEAPHVFFFDSVMVLRKKKLVSTTYVRKTQRNLQACRNNSADTITMIRVISPETAPLGAGEIDCCDVVSSAGKNITEVRYRACMEEETMA